MSRSKEYLRARKMRKWRERAEGVGLFITMLVGFLVVIAWGAALQAIGF